MPCLRQSASQTDGRKIEGCFVAGQGLRFLRPVGWMMLTGGQTDRMLTRLSLSPQETSQTSLETDGPDLGPPAPPPELQQVHTDYVLWGPSKCNMNAINCYTLTYISDAVLLNICSRFIHLPVSGISRQMCS